MTYNAVLWWWQNRYPQWASVTAPLVRHRVHDATPSVPLKTVLRLAFVRSLWRNESISLSNASSRLSNIYDCSAATIVEDLDRTGIRPLAEFIQQHPTQAQVSNATLSSSLQNRPYVIQDVLDFDTRLTDYRRDNETEISEAIAIVEATIPKLVNEDMGKLSPKKQDELCFEWSYYLAIADRLEPERLKLIKFVHPDKAPERIIAEKCRQFWGHLKELVDHARKNKPPQVLRTWLDDVEAWIQNSRLAFPEYQSAVQARTARKQKAETRFEQLLDEPSRQRLASIGEFTLAEEGKYGLRLTFKKLKELSQVWAPMSLQLIVDRAAKQTGFTETDQSRVGDILQRFTNDIPSLKTSAIRYARSMNFQLPQKGKWISSSDLTDDQLLRSVKKLTIQIFHPPTELETTIATLELDCQWDPEHGVRFGLMPDGEIVLQP